MTYRYWNVNHQAALNRIAEQDEEIERLKARITYLENELAFSVPISGRIGHTQ